MTNRADADTSQETKPTLIKALCLASVYDHDVVAVQVIETHISWILLTGQYAYKIKKPVNFGFLDFSSLAKRKFFCEEELRLNRRLSGELYLEVLPITGSSTAPKLSGTGPIIEFAIKMRQFPTGCLLSDRIQHGQLLPEHIDQLAARLANFHASIDQTQANSIFGNNTDIKFWFEENFAKIRLFLKDPDQQLQLQQIRSWGSSIELLKSELMQQRKNQGYVRECHGDLHLGNIAVIDGQITPFDCIEFNPLLRWTDVISEVAFVMMDLYHCGYQGFAMRFLNRYLHLTGDYQGMGLLRYYLVYRAMVRAKVTLLTIQQSKGFAYQQALAKAHEYINLAQRFTRQPQPMLIITHGYSGSGKSSYASQLAEKINALQLCSDIERKRLFGLSALATSDSGINSGLYTQDASQKTYGHLAGLAKTIIEAGFSVIIDATFLKSWQREMMSSAANEWGVAFFIIDFQATNGVLAKRILQRKNDVSEATLDVLEQQTRTAQPLSAVEQSHVITINTEAENALETLLKAFSSMDLSLCPNAGW